MRAPLLRAGLATLLGLGLAVAVEPAQAATPASGTIKLLDLGTFGGDVSATSGINERGQVVGYAQTAEGPMHPFLWERGVKRDLGTLGGAQGYGNGINERGLVVGNSATAGGQSHGFLWRDGRMIDLGTLAGGSGSSANFIDGQDQVFGRSFVADGTSLPYVWRNGVMRQLGAPGWTNIQVSDVSEGGHAVGTGTNPAGVQQGFRWYGGVLTALPSPQAGAATSARRVNSRGEVLGLVQPSGAAYRTVLWSRTGRVTQIGGDRWEPEGLNDLGHAVGATNVMAPQGFLWRCGKVIEIPVPGYTFNRGVLVNNRDDVVVHPSRWNEEEGFDERPWMLWSRGTLRTLEVLEPQDIDGNGTVNVWDLNDRGQIVGTAEAPNGPRAVLWNS